MYPYWTDLPGRGSNDLYRIAGADLLFTGACRQERKKVDRSVVKDYYKELNRRKNKEISFSELPDVLVDKMSDYGVELIDKKYD